MSTCLHRTLTCARALYIGKAAPTPCHDGLTSIQKPLSELYQKPDRQKAMQDQECIVYVFTSGIMIRPINRLDKEIWLRIQDLESCSAVKAYREAGSCQRQISFVPTDSAAGQSVDSPSLFASIMRRGEGIKISDCHAFLCFSDETALALVSACQQAFSNRSGWTNEKPNLVELGLERGEEKLDNECYVDDVKDDVGPEYYQKPSLSGFFYAPRSDLIQKFKIGGEDGFGRIVSDEPQMIEHFTHCEPDPEPERQCCGPRIEVIQINPAVANGPAAAQQQLVPMGGVQQQVIPQQAQLYYGQDSPYDAYYSDKKAIKKALKKQQQLAQDDDQYRYAQRGTQMNEYVIEDVRYAQQSAPYTVAPQDPVYAKVLPRAGADYRQEARMSGVGDYGPPGVVYTYGADADVYSRQLPPGPEAYNVYSGNPGQQNFILRKSDYYKA